MLKLKAEFTFHRHADNTQLYMVVKADDRVHAGKLEARLAVCEKISRNFLPLNSEYTNMLIVVLARLWHHLME